MLGRDEGDAPHVDLATEMAHGLFVRDNHAAIRACTDLSDGGLALAAFEMAEGAGLGVEIGVTGTAALFGEDQGRYLIAADEQSAAMLEAAAGSAGLPLARIGRFGGTKVSFGGATAPLAELSKLYRTAFESALHIPAAEAELAV